MTLAKIKARQILQELNIDTPELLRNLKEICCERGVFVRSAPLKSAEARLTVAGQRGIITVDANAAYEARQRFSIAHELGHFELHRNRQSLLSCDQHAVNRWSYSQKEEADLETEANEFASELLLPESFLLPEIRRIRPSIAFLERLAIRFQTSLFATTRRFIELTEEACAAVFFRNFSVLYSWKSDPLAKQPYRIEGKISPHSYAYDACQGKELPDHFSPVEASSWFKAPGRLAEEPLLEESRYFPSLNLGMALIWVQATHLMKPEKKFPYQESIARAWL
ncbi:MAG: ImmA/IrrE family metallo-endopeptidase [Bdellovibrionota bacterium]